ncbi:MAG: Cof-type HAD-IIB family hydrolase [Bacillota bacterium]|nr:Cof-type HAD-IIB family hydrolase [Bacillota bacterium]
MKIKLLALDLDDTLLDQDAKITPRAERAVKNAAKQGVKVVLATGRHFDCVKIYAAQLGLDAPVITQGGSEIFGMDGKRLYACFLSPRQAREIIAFALEEGVHYQTYTDDGFCYERENEYTRQYHEFNGLKGIEVPNLRDTEVHTPKVLLIEKPEKVTELMTKAKQRFGRKYNITTSKPIYLEFNRVGASKGAAVEYIAKMYGFSRENVMAIGDGLIDMSMILFAGFGVAMANASEAVRTTADYVARSNRDDGAARAIEQFILGS